MKLRDRAVDAMLISVGIVRTALDQGSGLRRRLGGSPAKSRWEQAARESWPPERGGGDGAGADEPDSGDWAAAVNGEPSERDLAPPPPPRTSFGGTLQLRFMRLKDAATLPERAHDGDAGLDLFAAEAARIGPGERVSVGTGLAVAIPEGYAGLVLPRSGLALKHGIGLANAPGLIDSGYRGEIRILLLNTDRSTECRVAQGDRIAQLVLVPVAAALPVEADALEGSARGSRGFGSSGL